MYVWNTGHYWGMVWSIKELKFKEKKVFFNEIHRYVSCWKNFLITKLFAKMHEMAYLSL